MEISVREMLKDVFPTNRRKLALGIVDYVKESRLSTMNTHLSGGKKYENGLKVCIKSIKNVCTD